MRRIIGGDEMKKVISFIVLVVLLISGFSSCVFAADVTCTSDGVELDSPGSGEYKLIVIIDGISYTAYVNINGTCSFAPTGQPPAVLPAVLPELPACNDATAPTCSGTCPPGQTCQYRRILRSDICLCDKPPRDPALPAPAE